MSLHYPGSVWCRSSHGPLCWWVCEGENAEARRQLRVYQLYNLDAKQGYCLPPLSHSSGDSGRCNEVRNRS